jgi:uncharacterized membrane protein
MKERLKNYALWLAVAGFVGLILQLCGVNVAPAQYDLVVNSFLGILVLAGILNNPTHGNGYKDKK